MSLLVAEGIHRRYQLPRTSPFGPRAVRTALGGVDLTLEDGGSLGIVGESGSGKSTLVRILLGLDRASEGTVRYRDPRDHAGPAAPAAVVPAGGPGRVAGPVELARPAHDRRLDRA